MDLAQLADAHRDRLTAADRSVLDVLLSHPTEAAFLSAEEVATSAGVHVSATTRLAQRLGLRGYPELRAGLRQRLVPDVDPAGRVRRRLAHTDGRGLLEAVVAEEVTALRDLPRHVAQADLDDVADRLAAARRVFLHAQGNATVLADLMARRLGRSGVDTVPLVGSGRDVAERLLTLTGDDLLLAFAFRRAPATLAPVLDHAATVGAPSVLVTDVLVALSPPPTVLLAAPRGSGRDFQSLTVPMALANALVLTLAARSPERALASLDRLGPLLQRFDAT